MKTILVNKEVEIKIYIYIYIDWLKPVNLIFSVYYQRFQEVLRLLSSDIAKDKQTKVKMQN